MKALIDTQVFIWLVNEDKRLGNKTRALLYDLENQLNISYFSIFEMTIKASIGKLDYSPEVLDDLPSMGIELLFPDKTTLQSYSIFNPDNKDPFDNALITVAIHEGYTLITSDAKILAVSNNNLKLLDAKE
jgi:PIN domain nuclease of toxin-antitoxin system